VDGQPATPHSNEEEHILMGRKYAFSIQPFLDRKRGFHGPSQACYAAIEDFDSQTCLSYWRDVTVDGRNTYEMHSTSHVFSVGASLRGEGLETTYLRSQTSPVHIGSQHSYEKEIEAVPVVLVQMWSLLSPKRGPGMTLAFMQTFCLFPSRAKVIHQMQKSPAFI
jgi:hypothetical protein